MSEIYLKNIKTTDTSIVGECPTCNYELGYNYGSNWRSHPINCSYASYSPGHIGCPKCGTSFVVGDIYKFPSNPEKAIYAVLKNQYKCKYCGSIQTCESAKKWIKSYCEESAKFVRLIKV
jgi:hypothetical protein